MHKTGSALGALAIASLALSGCGVEPVTFVRASQPSQGSILCSEIITQNVRVPLPGPAAAAAAAATAPAAATDDGQEQDLGASLETLLGKPVSEAGPLTPGKQPVSPSVLILSGGSQNGAFGAGFLDTWARERGPGLPRFRLVTGISTGSLQSTFAFLGKTDVPVREYSIAGEGDLLKPLVKGKLEDKPLSAGRKLATKGTLASLQPLRDRLTELISHDLMMEVAAQAAPGTPDERRLLVGAVEMSTGEMAVFDLTKAATIYAKSFRDSGGASTTDHPKAYMRQCYIEALMASSSVPMAAAPVFIDNRMYIDGGARFGVLVDLAAGAYQRAVASAEAGRSEAGQPEDTTARNLFILVNGTLEVPQLCRLGKCPVDANGKPKPLPDDVPHSEWDFLQVAQRSVSVLINQSYRSSVFIADGQYRSQGFATHFARIEPAHLTHSTAIDFPGAGSGEKTCAQWRDEDERIDKPMEFYPRFMRCLISYGRAAPKLREFIAAE